MCTNHDHGSRRAPPAGGEGRGGIGRRAVLHGGAGLVAAGAAATGIHGAAAAADPYAPPAEGALPASGFVFDRSRAALVVTDPQIDFLSPDGVAWGVVGESVREHGTVENIGRLFRAAKRAGMVVAVSPHYYYPHDHR
jgi:biuret amidohydrolase